MNHEKLKWKWCLGSDLNRTRSKPGPESLPHEPLWSQECETVFFCVGTVCSKDELKSWTLLLVLVLTQINLSVSVFYVSHKERHKKINNNNNNNNNDNMAACCRHFGKTSVNDFVFISRSAEHFRESGVIGRYGAVMSSALRRVSSR